MRPIDADALIKKFMNVCRTEFEIKNKCMTDENVIALIHNAPTVERPRGEWIELKTNPADFFGHRFYSCSKCGREIDVMTPEESLYDYPYCHCGADMRRKCCDD